jgi:YebC/PmpR family DNA-binding regulatory protein
MAGHNKWAQIKHKKAITDARKSKIFSKVVRLIATEAKIAKGDKNAPGLRAAIEKAKKVNMPAENIERAIKKANEPSTQMEAAIYEAYGPAGVGIIIETLTDNKNRTAQEIKHILSKNGFSLAGIGSVSWSFIKEKTPEGFIWKPNTLISLSDEDLVLLDKLVDELEESDDVQEVFTNAE